MEHEKKRVDYAHHQHGTKKFGIWNLFVIATLILGVVLIINIILTFNLSQELKKNTESTKEKLRPARIGLVVVVNNECTDCFNIVPVLNSVKNANVNVTDEKTIEFDSKEGKEFIRKYGILKVPSIVVTGEIDKVSLQGFGKKENALVFLSIKPPYSNALTGNIEGRVILYSLYDSECIKCGNLSLLISQIRGSGIKISEEKNVDVASSEGKELITKYKIDFAPSLILSEDAGLYDVVQQAWPRIGSRESDGFHVMRSPMPPFVNLTTGNLMGLVSIVYLTDKSCSECYNVNLHKEILTSPFSFAMRLEKEETVDASDAKGKELIAKYNITQVPTVIISSEASVYPSSQSLRQFFSIENDGSYIFRSPRVIGTYKDLATNEIIKAQQEQ